MKQDVCNRKNVVQSFEEEVRKLSRKMLVSPLGVEIDTSTINPKHYELENMGIRAKVECSTKLERQVEF
jgi:hypothetical protein